MSSNQVPNVAAVLETAKAPATIKTLPIPQPGPNEILVRNYAVAANPVDWKIQTFAFAVTKYPNVLGSDVAGIVESIGPDVTDFKPGDRVTGFAAVIYNQEITHGAWQTYTILRTLATTKIPDSISFTDASVLPMAFVTAAYSLYVDLGVPRPSISPARETGEGFLVWGGASSVGSAVIQLAKNSGFRVFATASKQHHSFLKSIGAYEVFDYHDSDVVSQITAAAKKAGSSIKLGVDAVGEGDASKLSADVIGEGKLGLVIPWNDKYEKPKGLELPVAGAYLLLTAQAELGQWFLNEYLKGALENGSVVPAPPAEIIDGGIASTQKVLDILKKGVSGKKLVVEVK